MIKYKMLSKESGDVNIEKKGDTVEFTATAVMDHLRKLSAQKTQFTSQEKLNSAEMKNMESFHPFVKDLSEKDLHTAHLYWESKRLHDAFAAKIPEIDEVIAEYKKTIKDVKEQTGINIEKYGQTGSAK